MRMSAGVNLVAAAVFCCICADRASAGGGDLDPVFGTDGVALANKIVPKADEASAAISLPGGKSLILGSSGIVALTATGELDRAFGQAGKIAIDQSFGASAFARTTTGKLLVLGESANQVMRLNADGSRDTQWGVNGYISLPIDEFGFPMWGNSIAITADGGFLIGGWGGLGVAAAAFHGNGSIDTSFGTEGMASSADFGFAFGSIAGNQQRVTVAQDGAGRVVLVAPSSGDGDPASLDIGVARLNANGTPDASFNGTGFQLVEHEGAEYVSGLAVLANNGLIIGGNNYQQDELASGVVTKLHANGAIDSAFGTNGWLDVEYAAAETANEVNAIIMDMHRVVVAGTTVDGNGKRQVGIARYFANGNADWTFSFDGRTVISNGTDADRAFALSRVAYGRYLLAGATVRDGNEDDYLAIRLNSHGNMDRSFSRDGKAQIGFWGNGAFAWLGMQQQQNGKLLGMGSLHNGAQYVEAMARYDADGRIDTSFGDDGWVQGIAAEHGGASRYFRNAAQHADGSIVACGELVGANAEVRGFFIERYNASGERDPTFGREIDLTPWSARAEKGGLCRRVVPMADGSTLLAVHGCANEAFVVKLTPTGALDQQFGNAGIFQYGYDPDWIINTSADGLVLLPDGKILVGGRYQDGSTADFDYLSFRLHADGTFDTSYNGTGSVKTDLLGARDVGSDIAMLPDGRFVIGGYSVNVETQAAEFSAARFHPDGSLDSSFHDDGMVSTALSGPAYAWHLALSTTGKTTLVGFVPSSDWDDKMAWLRLTATGEPDTAFTPTGILERDYPGFSDGLNAVMHQPDGKLVSAGSCAGRACLVRLMGDAAMPTSASNRVGAKQVLAKTGQPARQQNTKAKPQASAKQDEAQRCQLLWRQAQRLPAPQRAEQLLDSGCRFPNR